jgi:hypothetical protein
MTQTLQDADGHHASARIFSGLSRISVPTDDHASMNAQAKFERKLRDFPGIKNQASFKTFETWAHNTAVEWNLLSPYDQTMRTALPRYIQMLHQQLQARIMSGTDKIVGMNPRSTSIPLSRGLPRRNRASDEDNSDEDDQDASDHDEDSSDEDASDHNDISSAEDDERSAFLRFKILLLIGTQFSNLYTTVDKPAEAA